MNKATHRLKTNYQALILVSGLLFNPAHSEASLVSNCVRKLTQLALPYAVEYHTGKTLKSKNWPADTTEIVLGDRIGLGDRGGLYRIKPAANLDGLPSTMVGLVAKIPHTVKFSKESGPHGQAELEMKREILTYDLLRSKWQNVENDLSFPSDPAWKSGILPTAPILKTMETKEGTVLIKPEIRGESLEKLFKQHQGKLPLEMVNSLKDIYSTIDAVSHQVRTPIQDSEGKWIEGRPFYTDINPANLVWISNEAQMKLLGLKRPSFVFYEMTPLINRMPQYLDLEANQR